jgi:hypothetical protein
MPQLARITGVTQSCRRLTIRSHRLVDSGDFSLTADDIHSQERIKLTGSSRSEELFSVTSLMQAFADRCI